jgi:hypothetical protein
MRNQSVFVFDANRLFRDKNASRFCLELGYGGHLLKKDKNNFKIVVLVRPWELAKQLQK